MNENAYILYSLLGETSYGRALGPEGKLLLFVLATCETCVLATSFDFITFITFITRNKVEISTLLSRISTFITRNVDFISSYKSRNVEIKSS